MDWSNEKILEFIDHYQFEPVLWNPQEPNYKKKSMHHEAWLRIQNNLSFPVTVEELKTKMKSLMAYYRVHINKYKKLLKSAPDEDEVYRTTWFAFSAMHSFLARVYECQHTISTQINEEYEIPYTDDTDVSEKEEKPKINEVKKPRRGDLYSESIQSTSHMPGDFEHNKTRFDDEYEIFGKLLASKIRKLKNPEAREILMKDMYNLAFRAVMIDQSSQSSAPRQYTSQSPHDNV